MTILLRTTLIAGAMACLAAPALAQPAAGPRASALAAAQVPQAMLHPLPDPARELTARIPVSQPHLYYSVPLSAGMALVGALAGFGATSSEFTCVSEGPPCHDNPDNSEHVAMYAGLAAGAAMGAHLGGMRNDSRGNLLATLGGAALGALPLFFAVDDNDDNIDTALWVSVGTGTAGAVLMDYLIRRPRHRSQTVR